MEPVTTLLRLSVITLVLVRRMIIISRLFKNLSSSWRGTQHNVLGVVRTKREELRNMRSIDDSIGRRSQTEKFNHHTSRKLYVSEWLKVTYDFHPDVNLFRMFSAILCLLKCTMLARHVLVWLVLVRLVLVWLVLVRLVLVWLVLVDLC